MRVLVLGRRGLLGSAVCQALGARGDSVRTASVRWGGPECVADLERAFADLVAQPGEWGVAWCAGAGVTSTPQHVFDAEAEMFRQFIDVVAASGRGEDGTFFFASSAGALYAGSAGPPFTENSPVAPLAPYGFAKVDLESVASGLTTHGVRVVLGRLSNLYGPGQNLAKPQGLVSQLCLSLQTRRPLGIYVSLDTLRDYLFIKDAADLVARVIDRGARLQAGAPAVTKILAAQESVSIARLLGEVRTLTKRRPPVVLAASPQRAVQARDLRLRSVVWPDLDRVQRTPFAVGVAATLRDVGGRWRTGNLGT